jgi:hypothetical protein
MRCNFFEKTLASGEPVFPSWCEKNQKAAPTGRRYVRRERRKAMKFRTSFVVTGDFYEDSYVLHDTYYGEHSVEGEINLPFDIKDGAEYFHGALKVEEVGSEFAEITDEDFNARSRSGYYECRHVGYVLLSVTTTAKNADEAAEKAGLLVDEFLKIEDLRLDDIQLEEKDTVEVTETQSKAKE